MAAATATYQHHVRPIVERRCVACHGEQASGGLDFRSLAGVMAGGGSGPVVESGHPDKTLLWMGYHGNRKPSIGRDGRWLLHLYDRHNTRTEVMIRKRVEEPCCDELTDPYTE